MAPAEQVQVLFKYYFKDAVRGHFHYRFTTPEGTFFLKKSIGCVLFCFGDESPTIYAVFLQTLF